MSSNTAQPGRFGSDDDQASSAARSFLNAGIIISAIRFLGRGAAFAATVVASRNLNAEAFGVYAYVLTFLTAINVVGGLGLEQVALIALGRARALASRSALEDALARLGRRTPIVLPLASIAFAIPVASAVSSLPLVLAIVATGMFLSVVVVCAGVLRGLDKPVTSAVIQEAGRGLAFLIGAAPLLFGGTLADAWLATAMASGAVAAVSSVACIAAGRAVKKQFPLTGSSDLSAMFDMASQLRFLIILLATNVFLWTCPILLKRSAGIAEVGLFNVALQFPALISFLSTSLEMLYVPKIVSYWHSGRLHEMRPMIRTGSRLTLLAGGPVICALVVFSEPLLAIYGAAYVAAGPAMLVIVAAQIISVCCGPCGYLVLLTGRENLNLTGMAAGAAGGLLSVAVLAEPFGHLGAAIGFFVATAVPNLMFSVYCIRRLDINPTIFAAMSRPIHTEAVTQRSVA
jgi:O-antigen/teichoic acid export membrane protein